MLESDFSGRSQTVLASPFGVAELDDGQNEMRSLRMRTPESKMGA